MSAQEKAVGGYHTTATAIEKTHANVAPSCKKRHTALKRCATFNSGAEHTANSVSSPHDSGASPCPKFAFMGWVSRIRKVRGVSICTCSNTQSTLYGLNTVSSGFQSQIGAETMTEVNTPTTPKTGTTSPLARQQAIENALSTALYFVRLPSTDSGLKAATSRAIRAASMLKQACADLSIGGAA